MAILLALVILLCLLPSPTISSSLASPHKHKIRWRRWARIRSDNSVIGGASYDKSYILNESDFDEEEDEEYDNDRIQLDEESILSNSFRGGGAATSRTMNLPGLHSGWRSTKKRKKGRRSNDPTKRKLQQLKQQQLQGQLLQLKQPQLLYQLQQLKQPQLQGQLQQLKQPQLQDLQPLL